LAPTDFGLALDAANPMLKSRMFRTGNFEAVLFAVVTVVKRRKTTQALKGLGSIRIRDAVG